MTLLCPRRGNAAVPRPEHSQGLPGWSLPTPTSHTDAFSDIAGTQISFSLPPPAPGGKSPFILIPGVALGRDDTSPVVTHLHLLSTNPSFPASPHPCYPKQGCFLKSFQTCHLGFSVSFCPAIQDAANTGRAQPEGLVRCRGTSFPAVPLGDGSAPGTEGIPLLPCPHRIGDGGGCSNPAPGSPSLISLRLHSMVGGSRTGLPASGSGWGPRL